MYLNTSRGVSNIVLMIGIVITMAILLVGGTSVVMKLVDGEARASPIFIKTDLITIINTLDSSPETVTFNYYSDLDDNGFPLIGSLEIDDVSKQLCVAKKTEDEMFSTIFTKTAVAAGFGGVDYAYGKTRTLAARKATNKFVTGQQFGKLLPTISKADSKLVGRITANTAEGSLLRKYLYSPNMQMLTRKETAGMYRILWEPGMETKLEQIQRRMTPQEKRILMELDSPSFKRLSFVTRYLRGIKMWFGQKASRVTSVIAASAEKIVGPKVVRYVGGSFRVIRAGSTQAAIIGGIAAAQTILTGGDWDDFMWTTVQLSIYAVVPQVIKIFIQSKCFTWIVEKLSSRIATASTLEGTKGFLAMFLPPLWAQGACYSVHVAQVVANSFWTVWDMQLFDSWLLQIYNGAGSAVDAEKNAYSCGYMDTKTVLLSPPNCKPNVRFEGPLETWKSTAYAGAYLAASVAFDAATYAAVDNAAFICKNNGVSEIFAETTLLGLSAGVGAGTAGVATAFLAESLVKNPKGLVPVVYCDPAPNTASCDSTYLQQDCPNWFISQPVSAFDVAQTWAIIGLINGGPACIAISLSSGWGGITCSAARITLALSVFFSSPQTVFHVLMRTDQVGLTKEVNEPKSALGLDKEFSNNKGFWYAKLPYSLEITKLYTDNSTSVEDRTGNFIIRKA